MANQTKGFCKYCGKEYTKNGMLSHLKACKSRKAKLDLEIGRTQCGYFEVLIFGKYNKSYWLIIEISENATLKELDKFIRDIWVECCRHLSQFEINGMVYEMHSYIDSLWQPPTKSIDYKLKDVFVVGETVTYEYDFGSTTELVLNIHGYRTGERKKEKITILSRNNPLEILCSQCEKNRAQWIDPQRFYAGNPFWCEKCMREESTEDDESDEFDEELDEEYIPEYFLPVCNSPRMGVCGYEGSSVYSDQFLPDEK